MKSYDVIVLGVGGMGSAACCHLASRGVSVLGLEQFPLVHDRGSSHGQTRIIRKAYWEHPDYVPLLHLCYELWRELEHSTGQTLLEVTGLVMVGPSEGELVRGASESARAHRLGVEVLSADEVNRRFAAFHAPYEIVGLYEIDAGFLRVESCVQAYVDQARLMGAVIRGCCAVREWRAGGGEVVVKTDEGDFAARSLVVTAGPWSAWMLASLNLPLEVRRKPVFWFETDQPYWEHAAHCPLFAFDTCEGFYYGFPRIDGSGVKVAQHSGGATVADPSRLDTEIREDDIAPIRSFAEHHLNGLDHNPVRSSVCMYTMTPDQHFIVDRHPHHDNVFLACGFSGHGFKFAPVIGAILADWVTEGETRAPAAFLSLSRIQS